MEYWAIILLAVIILLLLFRASRKTPREKPVSKKPELRVLSVYDEEGYNQQGYNAVGRNRQGKYNRYYNVKCYQHGSHSEEGFLDIRKHPLYLTNHARERMQERMGIQNAAQMNRLAFDAYQFGKSKLQLMKSERAIIADKEQKYGNSVILIYRGYCYVFTENNGLKTIYKNDSVRV